MYKILAASIILALGIGVTFAFLGETTTADTPLGCSLKAGCSQTPAACKCDPCTCKDCKCASCKCQNGTCNPSKCDGVCPDACKDKCGTVKCKPKADAPNPSEQSVSPCLKAPCSQ